MEKARSENREPPPKSQIQARRHAHLECSGEEMSHQMQLCERCSNLKLDAILQGTYKKDDSFPVEEIGKLGPISTWDLEACDFCKLFEATIPSGEDGLYQDTSTCMFSILMATRHYRDCLGDSISELDFGPERLRTRNTSG
jgi:hypothetical protein